MEILIGLCGVIIVLLLICIGLLIRPNKNKEALQNLKQDVQGQMNSLGHLLSDTQKNNNQLLSDRLKEMSVNLNKINEVASFNNEAIRQQLLDTTNKLEEKVNLMMTQNEKKLEQMRLTVDEKLQETLDKRISQSFQLVSERLEQVYKGLGEMQTLATGVGDLKKVLSNVKTRGILGEIQLQAILEEILAPEQYDTNVATKKGSSAVVEFAVKLPADDNKVVYLPIDSKFPGDKYAQLVDAYEDGNVERINLALKELDTVIKKSAKDIHDKYIDVPNTTEFAIMFLPFEGLYAEVVRRGLVEILQRDYKINIAGPTTMALLLNSLQMGFKTLAIQKRSSEVWDVLGAVKTEFNKFGAVLENTQNKLNLAQKELDNLVGVRTRQIQRKLDKVTTLENPNIARAILEEKED